MLKIIRAKPNPEGENPTEKTIIDPKYRAAGEWFDIKNTSIFTKSLKGMEIYTLIYRKDGPSWESIFRFNDSDFIGGRKTIRVHSGNRVNIKGMCKIDIGGMLYIDQHYFTKVSYILSNTQMDKIGIYDGIGKKWLDEVYYDKMPKKGAVLEREGNKLIRRHYYKF